MSNQQKRLETTRAVARSRPLSVNDLLVLHHGAQVRLAALKRRNRGRAWRRRRERLIAWLTLGLIRRHTQAAPQPPKP